MGKMDVKSNNFVKYKDLLTIKEFDKETDKEEFCLLPLEDEYVVGKYQEGKNMLKYGKRVPVRKSVYNKLIEAGKLLKKYNSNYKLMVVYGLRDMKLQEKYFYDILEEEKNNFDDEMEMYEYIHEKIAVPTVAGHPTGGAVDIAICNEKYEILDFGSIILDWDDKKCYYNTENITEQAKENRKLLRKVMLENGFAPYDGEWWHYSYGDKEWAFYYKKEKALYNQVNAEDVLEKIKYITFVPGGNKTALVLGDNYSKRNMINDFIMEEDSTIEQVGFLNTNGKYELQMAGGEFCGNATRSSIFYYLNAKQGNLKITVNSKDIINGGIDENNDVWCEIPIELENQIEKIEDEVYKVNLKGMVSVIILENKAKEYLKDRTKLKEIGMSLIEKYNLKNNEAVGVMFLEKNEKLTINPVVWVRSINTLFYETACGSGTTATAMVKTFLSRKSQNIEILQPSNMTIKADIELNGDKIVGAKISGKVESNFEEKEITILR